MADERLQSLSTMAATMLERFTRRDPVERDRLARQLLQPRPGDAARVFVPELAMLLEPRVAAVWARQPMGPGPRQAEQTAVQVMATWSHELAQATDQPGRLVRLARYLRPDLAWFSWRYHRPGSEEGMLFEGLVWTGDHWAWFPRALSVARMPLEGEE